MLLEMDLLVASHLIHTSLFTIRQFHSLPIKFLEYRMQVPMDNSAVRVSLHSKLLSLLQRVDDFSNTKAEAPPVQGRNLPMHHVGPHYLSPVPLLGQDNP